MTAPRGGQIDGLSLASKEPCIGKMAHGKVRHQAGVAQIILPAQIPAQKRHGPGVGGAIIDVGGEIRPDIIQQPVPHLGQPGTPGGPFLCFQQFAAMVQRFAQGDGSEHGDAVPGGIAVVIEAAVIAEHVFLEGKERPGGREIFFLAGALGQQHHGKDRVAAAAVDHLAGRAQEAAVQLLYARSLHLQGNQPVAPGFQQGCIQVFHPESSFLFAGGSPKMRV